LHGAAPQPPGPAPSSAAGASAGAVAQLLIAGGATTAAAILLAFAVVCVRRHGCGCGKRANGDAGLLVIAEGVDVSSVVSAGGSGRSSPASYEQLATHRSQMREARVAQLRSSLGSTPSATPVLRAIAEAGGANDAPPLSLAGSSYSPPAPLRRDSPPQ
jgi:hypothetical protein